MWSRIHGISQVQVLAGAEAFRSRALMRELSHGRKLLRMASRRIMDVEHFWRPTRSGGSTCSHNRDGGLQTMEGRQHSARSRE